MSFFFRGCFFRFFFGIFFSHFLIFFFLRYMPPYTIHIVLTTDNSITVGGHFYSYLTFDRTLKALLAEHFAGNSLTNASHGQAAVILFRALVYVHRQVFAARDLHGQFSKSGNWSKLDEGILFRKICLFFLIFYTDINIL